MDPRQLPVTDDERSHIASVLQRAVGRGVIDLGQFSARLDAAYAATTRGELNRTVADLRDIAIDPAQQPVLPAPGSDRIRSVLSSVSRKGQWAVPERLSASSILGSTELDFVDARLPRTVYLEVEAWLGSTELRLPVGATADTSGVAVLGSSIDSKVDALPTPGALHVVISGRLVLSSLDIRYPKRDRLRRLFSGRS